MTGAEIPPPGEAWGTPIEHEPEHIPDVPPELGSPAVKRALREVSSGPPSQATHALTCRPVDQCANCGERVGTVWWGDTLALTHGGGVKWCEPCVLRKQIEHAEERAAALPGLRARLAEVEGTDA